MLYRKLKLFYVTAYDATKCVKGDLLQATTFIHYVSKRIRMNFSIDVWKH